MKPAISAKSLFMDISPLRGRSDRLVAKPLAPLLALAGDVAAPLNVGARRLRSAAIDRRCSRGGLRGALALAFPHVGADQQVEHDGTRDEGGALGAEFRQLGIDPLGVPLEQRRVGDFQLLESRAV